MTETAPASEDTDAGELGAGARLGRYVVRDRVGAGGMGVVYTAHDPELDRVVALKVLRRGAVEGSTPHSARQARLLREAQAMARLAHPNVITVHDVGKVNEAVFVAMEFIDGTTLRGWLRQSEHSVTEIVETYAKAGRGLAAAHAVELVHRDFKPANVLIGKDGRVLVTDFGLARRYGTGATGADAERITPPAGSPPPTLTSTLTATGQLLGTPAYMSPEQHAGSDADERSDQFSFCVALYEALYGDRPFPGASAAEITEAIAENRVRPEPRDTRVPQRLRAVLLRGLRSDPHERYPSMEALLDDLEPPRAGAGRPWLAVGGGLAIAAAVAFTFGYAKLGWFGGGETREACPSARPQLDGVWDDATKASLRAAVLGSKRDYAAASWDIVESDLDSYAGAWVDMHREACEATLVRGEQSPELLDLRMACLAQRRDELAALTSSLAAVDDDGLRRMNSAARTLTPLSICANREELTAPVPLPTDASTRARVVQIRRELANARTLDQLGKYKEALAAIDEIQKRTANLEYPPLTAEILVRRGEVLADSGRYEEVEPVLLEAVLAASAGRHYRAEARGYLLLADSVGFRLARYEQGHQWTRFAKAAIARIGGDLGFESELSNVTGTIFLGEGKYEEALASYTAALEGRIEFRGPDHSDVAAAHHNVATALRNLGRLDEALEHSRQALAIKTAAFGPDHPGVGGYRSHLGSVLSNAGRLDDAKVELEAALRIQRASLGEAHPSVAKTLSDLAGVYYQQADYAHAIEIMKQVAEAQEKHHGADHPELAVTYNNLGILMKKESRWDEGLAFYARALEIRTKVLRPDHPLTGTLHSNIGLLHLERGTLDEAVTSFENALAIYDRSATDPVSHAEARFGLARALWRIDEKRNRKRALELAKQARIGYAGAGEWAEEDLAEVDAWLASR